MTAYNRVTVGVSEWEDGADEPSKQRQCEVDEMVYDKHAGCIMITMVDEDTGRLFSMNIPVLAKPGWNEFVDSLPKWDN